MRRTRVPWLMSLLVVASATAPPGAVAQDPVGDAFCSLFTPQEVHDVLGTDVEATPSSTGCTWAATRPDELVTLSADWSTLTIAEHKELWPDGSDVTIGDRTAYMSPGFFLDELLIELEPGVLHLTIAGFDQDVEAALTQLGELGESRSASLPPPVRSLPTRIPSMNADPELEALFPATIGGEPVEVISLAGEAVISESEDRDAVAEALGSIGKTLDDLTGAFAFSTAGAIVAYRVAGADATSFLPLVIEAMSDAEPVLTPATVGGKDVSRLDGDTTFHVYPAGEVLWLVTADEPILTEILTALP